MLPDLSNAAADTIRAIRETVQAQPDGWFVGAGPLEQLAMRVVAGELSEDDALAEARSLVTHVEQWPQQYLRVLGGYLERYAIRGEEWRLALTIARLMVAVADDIPNDNDGAGAQGRAVAICTWLNVVRVALVREPDARLLKSAVELGERELRWAARNDKAELGTKLLFELGMLSFYPYASHGPSTNLDLEDLRWRQRHADSLATALVGVPDEDWQMPPAVIGLQRAEDYFRRAIAQAGDKDRGRILKFLAQTLQWQDRWGIQVDRTEAETLAAEAVAALGEDEHARVGAAAIQRWAGGEPEDVSLRRIQYLDELVNAMGPRDALDFSLEVIKAIPMEEYRILAEESITIIRQRRKLVDQWGTEASRISQYLCETTAITEVYAASMHEPSADFGGFVRLVMRQADNESWSALRKGATLLSVALEATRQPTHAELGLDALDAAVESAPLFFSEYTDTIRHIRGVLELNAGCALAARDEFDGALSRFVTALESFAQLRLDGYSIDSLDNINMILRLASGSAAAGVVARFHTLSLDLESRLGRPAIVRLQALYKQAIGVLLHAQATGTATSPDALILAMELSKGHRLATALVAGIPAERVQDRVGESLLEAIAQAEGESDLPTLTTTPRTLFDEGVLASGYEVATRSRSLHLPTHRLSNLQRRFDAHIDARLRRHSGMAPVFLSVKDVQQALDARTVLVNMFVGQTPAGEVSLSTILLTSDSISAYVTGQGNSAYTMSQLFSDDGRSILTSALALEVGYLRFAIQMEPGPRLIYSEAGHLLETHVEKYLGPLTEQLVQLRTQGYDHLCFCPHGPFHYYPLHLLGPTKRPLATDWIVTYLPNLHVLVAGRGKRTTRRHRPMPIVSLGLSYADDPRGLPEIRGSVDEATDVARVFGADPILDRAATKSAVRDGLEQARYLHVSAHGQHNPEAPAFNALFLSPIDGSGRVDAHEILKLDLRGLELVTLSACETALGRFDLADNLRGLPASLLLAGARAVVATLWPVSVASARRFFPLLYTGLRDGLPILDAFANAQRATRSDFPQHRDWGAFYMLGDSSSY